MTQSPENTGGQPEAQPPASPSPGDLDHVSPAPVTPPVTVPPPDTWHFPPEPVPAVAEATAAPPNGAPAPYGTSPHYGTPPRPGTGPARGYTPSYGPAYPARAGLPPAPDPTLAEWWRRLLARIIDVVVVGIVLIPVTVPLLSGPFGRLEQVTSQYPNLSAPGAESALSKADSKFLVALWLLALIAAAVWFLYDAVQHAKWGQTLGKRVLSTKVVSAYDRSPIGASAAIRRAAVYALVPVIPVVGTVFAFVNELWLLWDRRRQCLHDKAARTIVIRTNVPGGQQWQGSPW
jgi:uncharacterized RDD family membrane protein YckC